MIIILYNNPTEMKISFTQAKLYCLEQYSTDYDDYIDRIILQLSINEVG